MCFDENTDDEGNVKRNITKMTVSYYNNKLDTASTYLTNVTNEMQNTLNRLKYIESCTSQIQYNSNSITELRNVISLMPASEVSSYEFELLSTTVAQLENDVNSLSVSNIKNKIMPDVISSVRPVITSSLAYYIGINNEFPCPGGNNYKLDVDKCIELGVFVKA